jgi:SAM-dependent methyltransferase
MALSDATRIGADTPALPVGPPYRCSELTDWAGATFQMPPGDPRLQALHDGGAADTPQMANLQGLAAAWAKHPEWLDFMDPAAPNHQEKMLERALYLHHWAPWLPNQGRALDLGGGCGRFAAALLNRGLDVDILEPDLRSLWRALQHSLGKPGRVDVHWTTGECMPLLDPVDCIVAAEVLCYCEDPERIVQNAFNALKPGGVLLASVEARWGWAAAVDAQPGTLEALLTDGVVHVPGDMWVRTFEKEDFASLLSPFEVEFMLPTHYTLSGPFETAAGPLELEDLLSIEAKLRNHPRTAHLNRAWMAVARKPHPDGA